MSAAQPGIGPAPLPRTQLATKPTLPASRLPSESPGRPAAKLAEVVICALVPILLLYEATIGQALGRNPDGWHYGIDFHHVWRAGHAVLSGASPYVTPNSLLALRGHDIHAFVYPAPLALAAAPFGALPYGIAAGIYTAILLASLVLGLRLLGVRDWRCFGVAFLSVPVFTALSLGTLTPLLFVATAAAWRYRDRKWAPAMAVAAVLVIKLFLWPLVLWLFLTRRKTAALLSVGIAAGSTIISWWIIGFAGFHAYPSLLHALSQVEYDTSYSVSALAHSLGVGNSAAYAIAAAAGIAIIAMLVRITRRDPESPFALSLAIAAGLALTPILWLHYFALLIVPLALARPRLSALWFLPLAFWTTPWQLADGHAWRIALTAAVTAALLLAARGRPSVGAAT